MLRLAGILMVVAVAIGFALRGRLSNLARVDISWTPMMLVALVAGLFPRFVDVSRGVSTLLVVSANIAVLAFLVRNLARNRGIVRAGLAIIAVGWVLNAAVIIPNDGMPLSLWAYRTSGQTDVPQERSDGFFKGVIADEDTVLRPLGDVIPLVPLGVVVSAGDVALAAGIATVVAGGMTRRETEPPPPPSAGTAQTT